MVRRRRRADPPHGPSAGRPVGLGARIHLLPAVPRAGARPGGAGAAHGRGAPGLERGGARGRRRPRRGDAAPRPRAGARRAWSPLRRRRRCAPATWSARTARTRSCATRRASPSSTRGSPSAGSSSTSGRTTSRRCRPSPRTASGAIRRGRTCTRATAAITAASSSCCCRASGRGLRRRGPRVGAARAVVRAGRRCARPPCGLRVPRSPGGHHARRPRPAGRRRRAHHAAVHGAGPVLRRP